jgi:hypothetical protein
VRKKAQKGAKRRLHGGKRRPHGAKRRQNAHFGAFWRILANWEKYIVFFNYFLIFFFIFIKRIKKYAFVH